MTTFEDGAAINGQIQGDGALRGMLGGVVNISPEVDPTLSIEGAAADAKATGDALAEHDAAIDTQGDALARDEKRLDALWKLNQGQTYDVNEQVENGTNAPPSGAMFGTVLDVRGKSTQKTTDGHQLIDWSLVSPTKTVYGVTYTNLGDGRFGVSGTATINASTGTNYSVTLPTGTYRVSGNAGGIKCFAMYRAAGASYDTYKNDASFTLNSDTLVKFFIQTDSGYAVPDGTIVAPMLESGSTAHDWEPYTGGQPSPSPDYPQAVHSVESFTITVTDADDEIVDQRTITPPMPLTSVANDRYSAHDACDIDAGVWRYGIHQMTLPDTGWQFISTSNGGYYKLITGHVGVAGSTAPLISSHFAYSNNMSDSKFCFIFSFQSVAIGGADYIAKWPTLTDFETWLTENDVTLNFMLETPVTQTIAANDLAFLRSLNLLDADYVIRAVDQDGRDVDYLVEYLINLREAAGNA